jgi:2-polyprenyl-6-hydroxyphenyl methylase/3-demethylubiquinone-9 3-methyltransferase
MPDINEYYEQYWQSPEEYHDPTTPLRQALLDKHVGGLLKPGAKVLDVGCGRGEFCGFFAAKGCAAEGTDISTNCIEFARKHHPGCGFHAVAVEALLPARAGEFDLVFSSEVIEHLFDVATYLHAINHLLKPGGRVVLTTPYHGLVKNVLIDLRNYARHYDPLGQHIRFFDRASLGGCLEMFGFTPRVWTGYGRPWPLWKSFFVVAEKTSQAQMPTFATQGRHE